MDVLQHFDAKGFCFGWRVGLAALISVMVGQPIPYSVPRTVSIYVGFFCALLTLLIFLHWNSRISTLIDNMCHQVVVNSQLPHTQILFIVICPGSFKSSNGDFKIAKHHLESRVASLLYLSLCPYMQQTDISEYVHRWIIYLQLFVKK